LRPRSGCAVVAVAGVGAGPPERVDLLVRRSGEADVQAACDRPVADDRELVPLDEVVDLVVCSMPSVLSTVR
jgi:hypothetical protein